MSDEKKIIIDEDWKGAVEAEKEAARRGGAAKAPSEASAADPQAGPEALLPPASFEMLVTTLATEAMIGMGQIPHPMTGNVHADRAQARYAIDMLEMLAEKTKGNLTPGEDRGMRDLLHQLRMAFVASGIAAARDEPATAAASESSPLAES